MRRMASRRTTAAPAASAPGAAASALPAPGALAPPLVLPDQDDHVVELAKLVGRPVVVFFYPRDNTPGCTREACDFRDRTPALAQAGAVVLGVSRDTSASHRKFREKFTLPFTLLCDAGGAAAQTWGAWGEKVLYGKRSVGPVRTTVLIDAQGRVARVWSPVKVDGHGAEVLAAVQALG